MLLSQPGESQEVKLLQKNQTALLATIFKKKIAHHTDFLLVGVFLADDFFGGEVGGGGAVLVFLLKYTIPKVKESN